MVAWPLQSRRFSAAEPGQQGMVGHAGEDLPQAVLLHAEAETLLQNVGGLLEHDDFEPVADLGDVGRRTVHGEGGLADDEHVVAAKVGIRGDRFVTDAQLGEQLGRLALGVEQGRLGGQLGRFRGRQDVDRKGVLLGFARAELGRQVELIGAGLEVGRQGEAQRDALLLAGLDGELLAPAHRLSAAPATRSSRSRRSSASR